jgi:hypothetical protein
MPLSLQGTAKDNSRTSVEGYKGVAHYLHRSRASGPRWFMSEKGSAMFALPFKSGHLTQLLGMSAKDQNCVL